MKETTEDTREETSTGTIMGFDLLGRLVDALQGRGIPQHELIAVINSTLGQVSTLVIDDDFVIFPDGSRFVFQSGPGLFK